MNTREHYNASNAINNALSFKLNHVKYYISKDELRTAKCPFATVRDTVGSLHTLIADYGRSQYHLYTSTAH